MNNGAVTHDHCPTLQISAPLCDVTGIIAPTTAVINRLSILSRSQSPSPVPGKRSKLDKLQSSPAGKEQKPDWLQALSKSAHKVGTVFVSFKVISSNKKPLRSRSSLRVGDPGNCELAASNQPTCRPHVTGSQTGPAEAAALRFPPVVSQSARKRKSGHSE